MKKIVEIKRGDTVPANAKWLKDIVKDGEHYTEEGYDTFLGAKTATHGIRKVTYDVFEVPHEPN